MRRTTLAFAFGGKAAEHDLSVKSALYLLSHVDRERFRVLSLYVDPDGALAGRDVAAAKLTHALSHASGTIFGAGDDPAEDFSEWVLSTLPADGEEALSLLASREIGVAFPVFHGQGGEDALFQGFLETLRVPYVGCGVSGSVIGNDKAVNKAICAASGIPVTKFLVYHRDQWRDGRDARVQRAEEELGYPIFVKPPCLGSSVGISKAQDRQELLAAAETAFRYGDRLLLEKALVGREYGIGIIGNEAPRLSAIVEFGGGSNFLDYAAKYGSDAVEDTIPAVLDPSVERELRETALRVYRLLGLRGMSRLDFFVADGRLYFNESNTVPGFGRTSVFSKIWAAAGVDLRTLIGELVEYALERTP